MSRLHARLPSVREFAWMVLLQGLMLGYAAINLWFLESGDPRDRWVIWIAAGAASIFVGSRCLPSRIPKGKDGRRARLSSTERRAREKEWERRRPLRLGIVVGAVAGLLMPASLLISRIVLLLQG